MNHKVLQFSPHASARIMRPRIARDSRSSSQAVVLDMGFAHSWFEFDSDFDDMQTSNRVNWGAISGLALSVAISATCWAGVIWTVNHIWK